MRPEEGPYLAHRQWNPFPGPLPREHAHFGPRREHRGLHGDLVRMRRDIVRQDEDRRLQLAHEARVHGCRPATSMVRCPEGEVTQAYARLARNEVWRLVARLRARWCKREGAPRTQRSVARSVAVNPARPRPAGGSRSLLLQQVRGEPRRRAFLARRMRSTRGGFWKGADLDVPRRAVHPGRPGNPTP